MEGLDEYPEGREIWLEILAKTQQQQKKKSFICSVIYGMAGIWCDIHFYSFVFEIRKVLCSTEWMEMKMNMNTDWL